MARRPQYARRSLSDVTIARVTRDQVLGWYPESLEVDPRNLKALAQRCHPSPDAPSLLEGYFYWSPTHHDLHVFLVEPLKEAPRALHIQNALFDFLEVVGPLPEILYRVFETPVMEDAQHLCLPITRDMLGSDRHVQVYVCPHH